MNKNDKIIMNEKKEVFEHIDIIKAKEQKIQQENVEALKVVAEEIKVMFAYSTMQ